MKACSDEPIKGAEHLFNRVPKWIDPKGLARFTRWWTHQGIDIETIIPCGTSQTAKDHLKKIHKLAALWQKYLLLSDEFPTGMPEKSFEY